MAKLRIEKKERKFFPSEFNPEDWSEVEREMRAMLDRPLADAQALVRLIEQCGELSDIIGEVFAWKQIRMTQHADDPSLAQAQTEFYAGIIAPSQPLFFELEKKIVQSELFAGLPQERYGHLGKLLRHSIDIYREENIPLFVKENELGNKYGEMYSQLTVFWEGEEKTLSEMRLVQKDQDRARRERAWRLVQSRMLEAREGFEQLFDELKALRIQMAHNAGYANYRSYRHAALGRFDYTPDDLYGFHAAIEQMAAPVVRRINEDRRRRLGVAVLRPWDMMVDLDGRTLKPFTDTEQLLAGVVRIMRRIDSEFAEFLEALGESGLLDLPNRKGKAPGGYNCPLPMTGASFIFMNAVGLQMDVDTLSHEAGHGIHFYRRRNEPIGEYKNEPMEVAELASMAMELIASGYLDEFYTDPADIAKAQRSQLEDAVNVFPMVAEIDAFQHWIYTHPECSAQERGEQFALLRDRFDVGIDWTGLEKEKATGWLRVLHIYEVPFYYVEYALAELGAIALYKAYKEDPAKAVAGYKAFTELGYSKPVPEIYAAAGIKFDFSAAHLKEMAEFIFAEWEKTNQ